MANYNLSTAMNLPIPVVGVAPGPDWASYVNNCLSLLDQHTHSAGSGNPITPSGLNISGDLPFNGNNATFLRSTRYSPQVALLAGPLDLGCIYVQGVDLYFNDANGNKIRITQSASVAGTSGSIANLTSPASAAYSGGSQTFTWQSGANIPANLDAASVIIRNLTLNSNGITISAPNALASNYVLTLPAAPPTSTQIVSMNSAGQLSVVDVTDEVTIQVSAGVLSIKPAGITKPLLAPGVLPSLVQVILTSPLSNVGTGSIVVPAGVTAIIVEGLGGGAGGGAGCNNNQPPNLGAGGGGGAIPVFQIVPVTPGETLTYAVGAGGGGGGAGADGGFGGNSYIQRGSTQLFSAAPGSPGRSGLNGGAGGAWATSPVGAYSVASTLGGSGGAYQNAGSAGYTSNYGLGGPAGTSGSGAGGGGGGGGGGWNPTSVGVYGGAGGNGVYLGGGGIGSNGSGFGSGGGGGAAGTNGSNPGGSGGLGAAGYLKYSYVLGN